MRLRLLLAPVSGIYWLMTKALHWAYDKGLAKTRTFADFPVVCVGNITVGGTGKTPLTEHLLNILPSNVAVVSRGYGRKSKGMVVANSQSSAAEIGDEPCQMMGKHPGLMLVVNANRNEAIDYARAHGAQAVLMDDGMQHRSTTAGLYVMVCDYARPMWTDLMLPAGDMREPWSGRRRAQIVVVNKCPDNMTRDEANLIAQKMQLDDSQSIFFCSIGYDAYRSSTNEAILVPPSAPTVAVAGIGRPEPFFEEVERRQAQVKRLAFADHHTFTEADATLIQNALDNMGPNAILVTTEKDLTRLPDIARHAVVALPIGLRFLFGGQELFNKKILEYVYRRDS